jgi:uncharacterized protein HemY
MEDRTQPVLTEIAQHEESIKEKKAKMKLLSQGIKYDEGKLKLAKKYLESLTKDADK